MRLLIVTQAVDTGHPVLGFFHRWIIEFARHVEQITVICLYEGTHALPDHVRVYSLGKEKGARSPLSYAAAFAKRAWELRDEYDAVFVHMNPEYLMVFGFVWKLLGKRTALWYMHKHVSLRLHLGILFADAVFTASLRSMRVATHKKRVVGHGIQSGSLESPPEFPPLSLLTVGRISRVKRVHLLIDTIAALVRSGIDVRFTIAGGPAGDDGERYARELVGQVTALKLVDRITFLGPLPHARLAALFRDAHLFLHASATGSLDKASLEPLSAGVPVVTSDDELASAGIDGILLAEPNAESFAGVIRKAVGNRLWEHQDVRSEAHTYVHEHHELSRLIPRILAEPSFTGHR